MLSQLKFKVRLCWTLYLCCMVLTLSVYMTLICIAIIIMDVLFLPTPQWLELHLAEVNEYITNSINEE